jgi:hypothetical protein
MAYMNDFTPRHIRGREKHGGFFAKTSTPEARKENGGGRGGEGERERARQIKSKSVDLAHLGNGSGKEERTCCKLAMISLSSVPAAQLEASAATPPEGAERLQGFWLHS